jgi:opacity protein-like surface antigen
MKKHLIALCLLTIPSVSMAENESGAFVGIGRAVTVNDDCSQCDTSGTGFEAGYYFNKIVALEAKIASTEFDEDSDLETDLKYIGANIGHTFNTSWIRFYGKVGAVSVKQTDNYWNESDSESSLALGIGVSFTPFAHQSGVYFKLESMSAEVFDDTIGYGQLSVGYQF